jgi:hypothetical protein
MLENAGKDEKYSWKELNETVRRWAVTTQHEKDQEWYQNLKESYEKEMTKSWKTDLIEIDDGTGDAILQFPDELIKMKGWKEGTILNMVVESGPAGNVLVITEKI